MPFRRPKPEESPDKLNRSGRKNPPNPGYGGIPNDCPKCGKELLRHTIRVPRFSPCTLLDCGFKSCADCLITVRLATRQWFGIEPPPPTVAT